MLSGWQGTDLAFSELEQVGPAPTLGYRRPRLQRLRSWRYSSRYVGRVEWSDSSSRVFRRKDH